MNLKSPFPFLFPDGISHPTMANTGPSLRHGMPPFSLKAISSLFKTPNWQHHRSEEISFPSQPQLLAINASISPLSPLLWPFLPVSTTQTLPQPSLLLNYTCNPELLCSQINFNLLVTHLCTLDQASRGPKSCMFWSPHYIQNLEPRFLIHVIKWTKYSCK